MSLKVTLVLKSYDPVNIILKASFWFMRSRQNSQIDSDLKICCFSGLMMKRYMYTKEGEGEDVAGVARASRIMAEMRNS